MTSTNHTDNSHASDRLIRRRLPRRDESGLTTLEWLLIVAAVAGLAALAVVLVTNVVSDTGEQIEGQGARRTAAVFAAQSIMDDADRDADQQPGRANTWAEWETYYDDRCTQLRLTYGDTGVTINSAFLHTHGAGAGNGNDDPVAAGSITTALPSAVTLLTASSTVGEAVAHCQVLQ